MRRLFVLLAAIFASTCMMAQSRADSIDVTTVVGSFDDLKSVRKLHFQEDWTQVEINGMTVDEWLDYRQATQPEWDADHEWEYELKPRAKETLMTANEAFERTGILLTTSATASHTLVFRPLSVDRKGNQVDECVVRDNQTGRDVVTFYVVGKGGTFGSMSNLWGDGFRSAGKRLARMLKRNLLK